MNRYCIKFSYKGTNYSGWQIQPQGVTIQGVLQKFLSKILNCSIKLIGSSRTDAGVHAECQFAHFDIEKRVCCEKVLYGLNSLLPDDIYVNKLFSVENNYHARFNSVSRTYEYTILQKPNPLLSDITYFYPNVLCLKSINAVLGYMENKELFFKAFCKVGSFSGTYRCKVFYAKFFEISNDKLIFKITANRFLRGMVRILVGYLIMVGEKKLSIDSFIELFSEKNFESVKKLNPPLSVPARGLSLINICMDV